MCKVSVCSTKSVKHMQMQRMNFVVQYECAQFKIKVGNVVADKSAQRNRGCGNGRANWIGDKHIHPEKVDN